MPELYKIGEERKIILIFYLFVCILAKVYCHNSKAQYSGSKDKKFFFSSHVSVQARGTDEQLCPHEHLETYVDLGLICSATIP